MIPYRISENQVVHNSISSGTVPTSSSSGQHALGNNVLKLRVRTCSAAVVSFYGDGGQIVISIVINQNGLYATSHSNITMASHSKQHTR